MTSKTYVVRAGTKKGAGRYLSLIEEGGNQEWSDEQADALRFDTRSAARQARIWCDCPPTRTVVLGPAEDLAARAATAEEDARRLRRELAAANESAKVMETEVAGWRQAFGDLRGKLVALAAEPNVPATKAPDVPERVIRLRPVTTTTWQKVDESTVQPRTR